MRVIIIFIFAFFAISFSSAQHPPVRNFNRKTTQGGTQNWDIIQRQNDWMYFANNNGLLEFDGNRWSIYPIGNYTNVRSLYYDQDHDRIYAGAFNEFGYYERDPSGLLKYFSLVEKIKLSERMFNEIWNIVNVNNMLFFQGDKEIFQHKDGNIKRFNFTYKIDCINSVHNLLIIAGFDNGVSMLSGDIFIQLPNSSILKEKKVCAILPFKDDKILFVTDFYGLFVFDGNKVEPLPTDIDDFLYANQAFCANINGSTLAIGTVRNGLVVKDFKTNTNIFSNIHSELQNNTVLSLAFDNQENLWLGLDKGIDYVMINSPVYDLFGNNQLYGAGYTSAIKGNLLYLGTNQGLYATSFPLNNQPSQISLRPFKQVLGQVWSLELIDNILFCGTDHGAFIIEKEEAIQIKGISGTWGFKKLNQHPNYILGSSYNGFFLLKKKQNKWEFSHFIKDFNESGAMFEEDQEGNIWFSHWMKGFYKLTFSKDLDRFHVDVFDTSKGFYTERNGVLFKIDNQIIFSSDGGFFEYSKAQNKVIHSSQMEQIFGLRPYSMKLTKSKDGSIWHISPQRLEVAILESDNSYMRKNTFLPLLNNRLIPGFQQLNFVNDSNVIINTEDGFSWLDFSKIDAQTNNPIKVSIRHVFITNKQDSIVGGHQAASDEVPKFKYKNNSIRFEFSAPEYTDENAVQYSYFLENYDLDWSVYSLANIKEYTKLPKGQYTFRVKARKVSNTDASAAETYYQFAILPPWYDTLFARVVYILLLILILFFVLKYIKRLSEKELREMESQKEKEIEAQKESFKAVAKEKEKEIIELKNQRLKYDLRHKSQELASSTMNLIRKNEILLKISQVLFKVSKELKSTNNLNTIEAYLADIQNDIKKNIARDDNWKKFEANFDIVYENFLKHLGEKFPELTINDKKLCAYLKMGLSSKDIAPLMNLSFRSVEMSRHRLRKKLNLDRDVNLTDYLQKL